MKHRVCGPLAWAISVTAALAAQPAADGDWPQWRGPDRNGISRETGLLQQWPSGGPAVVWSATGLGAGYGSVAVKDARVFVQGLRGRQSMVHSLDRTNGKYLWSKNLGSGGTNDRGSGPRSTPTLDGARLYVLTENGDLVCLRDNGTEVWQRNILRDFSGSNISWLLSESPLVDGDRVIARLPAAAPGTDYITAELDESQSDVGYSLCGFRWLRG